MATATEVLALAAAAGVAVVLVRFLLAYMHFRKLELAIPGPPSLPLLGNALDLARLTPETSLKTLLKFADGRKKLCRFSLFNQLFIMVQDPAELSELMRRKEFQNKSVLFYSLIHVIAHKGLVQLSGAEWRAHRRWLEPGFNKKILDSYVDIFNEEARNFVARIKPNTEMNVLDNVREQAIGVFLRTSMSSDTSAFTKDLMGIASFLEVFLRSINIRTFNPLMWSETLFSWTAVGKEIQEMKIFVENVVRKLIAKKRQEIQNNNHCDYGKVHKTLMDIMLDESNLDGQSFTEEQVVDEFKTFFGASIETTVSAVTWMLKVLSMLPDVQEKVYAEVVSVLGESDGEIYSDDLPKMSYLERVIKECMRMFPAVPMVGRQCTEETTLAGRRLPAGTGIIVNIYGVHHNEDHWPQPERFDPDRFLPENCKSRHPLAYIPFSAGPRNCIAMKHAMTNMATLLAVTLRSYELVATDDHKDLQSLSDNMSFDLSTRLVGGTRVVFRPRGARAA